MASVATIQPLEKSETKPDEEKSSPTTPEANKSTRVSTTEVPATPEDEEKKKEKKKEEGFRVCKSAWTAIIYSVYALWRVCLCVQEIENGRQKTKSAVGLQVCTAYRHPKRNVEICFWRVWPNSGFRSTLQEIHLEQNKTAQHVINWQIHSKRRRPWWVPAC